MLLLLLNSENVGHILRYQQRTSGLDSTRFVENLDGFSFNCGDVWVDNRAEQLVVMQHINLFVIN